MPPPEPVNDKKRMVAILPYTKMPDTDEITFQKGDIFFVHNDLGDGWLWVTAHRTGEQGLVFKDLLADLAEEIDPNAVFPWFHRNLSKVGRPLLSLSWFNLIHLFFYEKCKSQQPVA